MKDNNTNNPYGLTDSQIEAISYMASMILFMDANKKVPATFLKNEENIDFLVRSLAATIYNGIDLNILKTCGIDSASFLLLDTLQKACRKLMKATEKKHGFIIPVVNYHPSLGGASIDFNANKAHKEANNQTEEDEEGEEPTKLTPEEMEILNGIIKDAMQIAVDLGLDDTTKEFFIKQTIAQRFPNLKVNFTVAKDMKEFEKISANLEKDLGKPSEIIINKRKNPDELSNN